MFCTNLGQVVPTYAVIFYVCVFPLLFPVLGCFLISVIFEYLKNSSKDSYTKISSEIKYTRSKVLASLYLNPSAKQVFVPLKNDTVLKMSCLGDHKKQPLFYDLCLIFWGDLGIPLYSGAPCLTLQFVCPCPLYDWIYLHDIRNFVDYEPQSSVRYKCILCQIKHPVDLGHWPLILNLHTLSTPVWVNKL